MKKASRILAFWFLVLLHPVVFAIDPLAPSKPAEVTVDYRDGSYFGRLGLTVAVSPQIAMDVLTDFDHMADYVPNLKSSKLLAYGGNRYRVAQRGRADFGPFSFHFESEREIELFPDRRLVSQRISGSPQSMRSELRIQAVTGGVRLDYQVEMVPDHWFPAGIGTYFIRHELAEQFMALAREMERRQKISTTPPN